MVAVTTATAGANINPKKYGKSINKLYTKPIPQVKPKFCFVKTELFVIVILCLSKL